MLFKVFDDIFRTENTERENSSFDTVPKIIFFRNLTKKKLVSCNFHSIVIFL